MRPAPILALVLTGCATLRPGDPAREARAVVRRAAQALARSDQPGLAALVSPGVAPPPSPLDEGERASVIGRLRAAAEGRAMVHARVQVTGPIGTQVWLEQGEEGWRVAPDTVSAPMPTPVAAIEQLIVALERMESDPALALLSSSLRDALVAAARERARGLREALPRLPGDAAGRLTLQVDYGAGLFIVLRPEAGAWRIDDFN
jgi:hypothetical protein